MNMQVIPEELEVGYNIPAMVGMDEADIQTPCLILDLDALERNIIKKIQLLQISKHAFPIIYLLECVLNHPHL